MTILKSTSQQQQRSVGQLCPTHIDNNKLDSSNPVTPPPRCRGRRPSSSSCTCLLEVPVEGLVGPVSVGGQISPAGSARAGMVLLALGLAAAASVLLLGGRNWGSPWDGKVGKSLQAHLVSIAGLDGDRADVRARPELPLRAEPAGQLAQLPNQARLLALLARDPFALGGTGGK